MKIALKAKRLVFTNPLVGYLAVCTRDTFELLIEILYRSMANLAEYPARFHSIICMGGTSWMSCLVASLAIEGGRSSRTARSFGQNYINRLTSSEDRTGPIGKTGLLIQPVTYCEKLS